ncbi:hypothetical protein B0O80DRAFT_190748 [Mortierella sp. GBAus27b]|nr:hypothetical protein B0O80DRAFT_190748 [Mortierella sp. GBAus27b]
MQPLSWSQPPRSSFCSGLQDSIIGERLHCSGFSGFRTGKTTPSCPRRPVFAGSPYVPFFIHSGSNVSTMATNSSNNNQQHSIGGFKSRQRQDNSLSPPVPNPPAGCRSGT